MANYANVRQFNMQINGLGNEWDCSDLGREEEGGGGDGVPVETCEGVEHVEPLHVHNRRVDT